LAWEFLSSTVLGSAGDTIDSGTIDAKLTLFAILGIKDSATANVKVQFNNVTSASYCTRYAENGGSSVSNNNQTSIRIYQTGSGTDIERYIPMYIVNEPDQEKLLIAQVNESTTSGAGTAPVRSEHYGKLATTGSSITSIQIINDTTGSFAADSYLTVFGSD